MLQAKIKCIFDLFKGKLAPQAIFFEIFDTRNSIFNSFSFKSDVKSWKIFRLRRDSLNKKQQGKNSRIRKPPLLSDRGKSRGGFLIRKNFLSQKCYFWAFQKNTTFSIFFTRFFSHDLCWIATKQYLIISKIKNTSNIDKNC